MDKKYIYEISKKILLFLLAVFICIAGYAYNEKYKEANNIDSSTGATQTTDN